MIINVAVCSFIENCFNVGFKTYRNNVCPDDYKVLLVLTVFQSVV